MPCFLFVGPVATRHEPAERAARAARRHEALMAGLAAYAPLGLSVAFMVAGAVDSEIGAEVLIAEGRVRDAAACLRNAANALAAAEKFARIDHRARRRNRRTAKRSAARAARGAR